MMSAKKKVIFYRRLRNPNAGSNGGNLKLRDCFDHIRHASVYLPKVYFSEDTKWFDQVGNYWKGLAADTLLEWKVETGDLLFFSGGDWQVLPPDQRNHPPVPVINIVQPRHTRAEDKRKLYLSHPAIRIAKSQHGADILREHGVNGPLFVIPDTIDLDLLPTVPAQKEIDILIIGLKQPELAKQLLQQLEQWNKRYDKKLRIEVQLPPKLPRREDFLDLLSKAKIAACLPLAFEEGAEGFYLPALEAMALETFVVCPHAIGNVDHCLDGINCLVPDFSLASIFDSVCKAVALAEHEKYAFIQEGLRTAEKHSLLYERKAVLNLIDQAYALWADKSLFTTYG